MTIALLTKNRVGENGTERLNSSMNRKDLCKNSQFSELSSS